MGFIRRFFIGDPGDPTELDFLPLNTMPKAIDTPTVASPKPLPPPPDWQIKMVEARRKLGRPFAPEVRAPRTTEPSRDLEYIREQAEAAKRPKASVTPMGKKSSR